MQIASEYNPATLSLKSQQVINKSTQPHGDNHEAAMKAAKEFETVFITSMLENMFSGVEVSEPFGGGHSEKIFRSMQNAEYAKSMSENGGLGLAEHVYREIIAVQESSR